MKVEKKNWWSFSTTTRQEILIANDQSRLEWFSEVGKAFDSIHKAEGLWVFYPYDMAFSFFFVWATSHEWSIDDAPEWCLTIDRYHGLVLDTGEKRHKLCDAFE